ncbi:AraC family transcriptional regulator [Cognatishimia sp. SS12]|uniref:helix-turn-helix domain-containing protein n=1 Tax=Cognatishimia sp. SS12 TaxID=2979465 RepID=UPI00232B17C3|nr:AraC family transcriptional regulator [Cognatishimia sp. SS12]MDC0738868.1 AraC family transcriptional regulator [Cognatishimia sp. SS12]
MTNSPAAPAAYAFVANFDPEPQKTLRLDRHYLLYNSHGAVRLSAGNRGWSLPPARAALIRAGCDINITVVRALTTCSLLFDPDWFAEPDAPLSVFEVTPLARELIHACRPYGPEADLDDYGRQLFDTVAAVSWRLARTPSPAVLPAPSNPALQQALAMTEAALDQAPSFEAIARGVGLSPRSLARRFADDLGMTWRQAQRRLRMSRAIEALATSDRPVTEIAFAVGYNSLSAFNAAFLDLTGQTPTDYRKSLTRA